MQAIKAFFGKVWAWVLAHKIIAGVIAGAVTLAVVTAIVVPVSVSSAKKKRAAEQETQQTDNGGSQSGDQGGSGSGGSGDSGGSQAHTHNFVFKDFVWTTTPGAYTAKARYECAEDKEIELHDATVTKQTELHVDPTCAATGSDTWHAEYDGHSDDIVEGLEALGHLWGANPNWVWSGDHQTATATFECQRPGCTETHEETATMANGIEIQHTIPAGHEDDGQDSYVATVTLDGTNYSSDPELVDVPATGHNWNEFGLCVEDGAYRGDLLTSNVTEIIGEMDDGDTAYYRIPMTAGHLALYVATELSSEEISFSYNNHGTPVPVTINTTSTLVSNVGADGFIYVKIVATGSKTDARITVTERHYGNYVGICHGCGDWLFPDNEMEVGTSKTGINLTTGSRKYFRCPAIPGHTYGITKNLISTGDFHFYYMGQGGSDDVQDLVLSDPFPDDSADNYIYIVIVPTADSSNASMTINITGGHSYSGLGLCACGDYVGSNLTNAVGVGPFDLASGTSRFFRYTVVATGEVGLDVNFVFSNWSAPGMDHEQVTCTLYLKTSTGFEPCDISQPGQMEDEWKTADGWFTKDDEVYIVITNGANISVTNMTVTLTEF